jgi:hypothetical protein
MKFAVAGASLRSDDELGLIKNGFKTIKIPSCDTISGSVSTHADTVLFFLRDRLFMPRDYFEANRAVLEEILELASLKPMLTVSLPRSPYPNDVPLCALNVGDRAVIGSRRHLAPEIISFCEENGIPIHNTRQGYAKCTAAYMGGIISADPSTLLAAERCMIDSLRISPGSVLLDGYDYGFIGGASGFDGRSLYFCGDVDLHPDGSAIRSFCDDHGIGCVSLSPLPLHDVGGIFFF